MILRLTVIVVLLLWKFKFLPVPMLIVEGHPTIQCAQTGASLKVDSDRRWDRPYGSFTIGAKTFNIKYGAAMYSGFFFPYGVALSELFKQNGDEKLYCNYTFHPDIGWEVRLCDELDQLMKLRINAVQQTDPSTDKLITLQGWLHIELELVDEEDSILMMYAQMYDEHLNAIGEFVKDPTEQCPSSDPQNYVSPTVYQYLPCSAIGAREAKPSEAVYMVNPHELIDKSLNVSRYFPPKELKRKLHFTWRMNEYWCSRHYRIIPMIFVLTKKNQDSWITTTNNGKTRDPIFGPLHGARKLGDWKLYRKIPISWLIPDWIGAADLKHPERGDIQCNNSIQEAPWIRGKFLHTVHQEYLHPRNLYNVEAQIRGCRTCQQNPFFIIEYSKFVGRCKAHVGKDTSHEYYHKCNTNPNSPEFQGLNVTFDKYTEYVNNLTTVRSEYCHRPCRAPETVEDAIDISKQNASFTKPAIDVGHGLIHNTRSKSSVISFRRGRKFHGIMCLIVTMFLMPVSNFLARYYKETYMDVQFKGVHVWYWVHAGGSIGSMGILLAGHFAMSHSMESWGRSKSEYAIFHHSLGWISIFTHILMVMYGGIRSAVMSRRKFLMKAHSIVGFGLYIFNILLIVSSTYIPFSPSLRQCNRDGLPTGFSVTLWLTLVWTGLDAIFNLFLTALQVTADRTLQIKRPMSYCPILPILDPNSHEDMRRSGLRKLLLYFYLFVSVILTLVATVDLAAKSKPDGCIIGEMSCKAALGCTKVALAMCRKLKYEICTGGSRFTFPI
ncbi:unnamed protein product [Orchesella dallaii]|uniref:Ferric-chelate reductase 1 n=2 Tax=Orchesella dallaii TaxID=48710 RepID=A0ABP1S740_9HEXA